MSEQNDRPWKLIEEIALNAKGSSNSLVKLTSKIQEICAEGSLNRYGEIAEKVAMEIAKLSAQIKSIENLISDVRKSANELQAEVEGLCKEPKISDTIFSSGPNLIVFPMIVRFGMNGLDPEINIGSEKIKSYRPDFIVKRIREQILKPFDAESFLKSVKAAYSLLLRSENQRDVSLEDIRQLIGISHDSTSRCSKEQFATYIQRLYSTDQSNPSLILPRFIPVAAATRSYLLIGRDGSSISVSSISFERTGTK